MEVERGFFGRRVLGKARTRTQGSRKQTYAEARAMKRYGLCKYPIAETNGVEVLCNMKTESGFPHCEIHAREVYVGSAAKQETETQSQDKIT